VIAGVDRDRSTVMQSLAALKLEAAIHGRTFNQEHAIAPLWKNEISHDQAIRHP
jgi:hypothetical protein